MPRQPKQLESFLSRLREVQAKFSRFYTRILNQAGLTQSQYGVLAELSYAAPKPLPMTVISQKLFITKPAVTNLADRLEKQGLLKRVNHPEDRRVSLLKIQPKGSRIVESVRERMLGIVMHTASRSSAAERTIVEKFYTNLSMSFDEILCSKKECKL